MNKKLLILSSSVLALSIIASPISSASAAKRKTLFEVLFPRAAESRLRRNRALNPPPDISKVKVSTPKAYTYRLDKPARIEIHSAISVGVVASATPGNLVVSKPTPSLSRFQSDLENSGELGLMAEAKFATAISNYYDENPAYRWIDEAGQPNARARSVRHLLDTADKFGLQSRDYAFVSYPVATNADEATRALARIRCELSLTLAVLRYAFDARYGTINPNRLSGYHDFPNRPGKADAVLAELLNSEAPAILLPRFHPTNQKFLALKSELASLRGSKDISINLDPEKRLLIKPGSEHANFPDVIDAIKKRSSSGLLETHAEALGNYQGGTLYSPELVKLVIAYQREAGLGPDGIIGRRTVARLVGVGSASKISRVVLAMERLRWLPHDLGERHVFINQPAYRAMYIADGMEKLSMRAIVGKPSNQTSFFYDEIETVVYNPYWGVPRSIIVNEMLPKLRADPSYLDNRGFEVTNTKGQRIASSSIDWWQVGANPGYDVRQPPGARNALGRVKILFPNKHAIYMHDTPSRGLFERSKRALSHGCVRLQQPLLMAAAVLGRSKNYVSSKISTGRNTTEKLSVRMPVYVSYFTAWPGADGTIGYYPDIYGRDRNLEKARNKTAQFRITHTPST